MKTFRLGGIHPKENKFSAGKKIQIADIPKQVIIPLSHYIGTPSEAVVKKGESVKVGQLIGRANGFISAHVHASVSGKVSKVDVQLDASGYRRPAVFIDVEGDEWLDTIDKSADLIQECKLSKTEIRQRIQDAGIVGLGGATFPAHVKLSPPPGKKATCVIINAVECESYLTNDHALMLEKPDEILVGVQITMKVLEVQKAYIGIENNKPDAIQLLSKLAKNYPGIEIVPLQVRYPQGGEKQLIDAIIRRQVPSGRIPIEVGAVVQNVGTVFAIYEAVQKNKPMVERIITVTGKSAPNPGNFKVRIGTMLSEIAEKSGGVPADTGKIVGGGPMMGRSLMTLDVPTAKGSAGILYMQQAESLRKPMKNCIRCAKCVTVCPMGLEPFLLMNQSERSMWSEMEGDRVMDCIECGSCSYTCPSNRPLLDYIRFGKSTVGGIIRNRAAVK